MREPSGPTFAVPCPAVPRSSLFASVYPSFSLALSVSPPSAPPSRPVRVSFSRPLLRLLCLRLARSLAYSHLDLSLRKLIVREFRIRCSPDLSVKDASRSLVISVSKISNILINDIRKVFWNIRICIIYIYIIKKCY